MFNRWDWLDGLKKESATTTAVKYMARLIADALLAWPPEVEMHPGADSRFAEVLAEGAPRPSQAAFTEALKRARWELNREFDARMFYERNHHLEGACPELRDQQASEFIEHYVLEAFYSLMERTEYRIKRKDIRPGIDYVETRLRGEWLRTVN